jgi:ABC-type xylose transport system substrate-binding protein
MMSCITAGDSIGDGIHHYAPACTSMAHKGWSSARWHRHYAKITLSADRVLISLGSNDGRGDTASQIAAIRKQVKARQVVWVVPACNPRAAMAVEAEAARHGDALVWIRHTGPDQCIRRCENTENWQSAAAWLE